MRRFSIACICLLTSLAALVGAGPAAAAVTLGSTVQPAGSTPACMEGAVIAQATSGPGVSYAIPADGGSITQWELNTVGSTPGAAITLVVLRPTGASSSEVVGIDAEALPNPLPAGGVASFPLASPITVRGGDLLGLYVPGPGANCWFMGGATPTADTLTAFTAPVAPALGQTLALGPGNSPPEYTLNLAATLQSGQDVAVTTTASPANATVGALAVLGSTVVNNGPQAGPIAFTDVVPSGLSVGAAAAGSGTCTTAGQTVSCTIDGLAVGQSAPVLVLVTPTAAGSYPNTVSVAPQGGPDPSPANNSAAATLTVGAAAATVNARACVVPNLQGFKLADARRLLAPLGCKVGKVRHAHNKKIAAGAVVRTTPKRGTYATGRKVGLVVSSGPPRHRHHRHA